MLRAIADGLLAVVVAPGCAACRQPLDTPTRSVVCERCWCAIRLLHPPLCLTCSDPLPFSQTGHDTLKCSYCRDAGTGVTIGRALGEYNDAMRAILHALKYDGRRSIASTLSALMRAHRADALAGADCVVPVPLHWRRRWRRGFNQADDLAAGLGLPVVHGLARRRNTPSQADLPASRRDANVREAFRPVAALTLRGACVVLVDDVSTTGATLDACARALLDGGVREVRSLTAARVVRRPPAGSPRPRPRAADRRG